MTTDLAALELEIAALETQRTLLFDQRQPLDDAIAVVSKQIREAAERFGQMKVAALKAQTRLSVEDWKWLIKARGEDRGGTALYHYFCKLTDETFGLESRGINPDVYEAYFSLAVLKDNKQREAQNREGIRFLAPILTPTVDENGGTGSEYVYFGIREHTCSEHGSYTLLVKPDLSKFVLSKTAWHRNSTEHVFNDLDTAIAYIGTHHWSD